MDQKNHPNQLRRVCFYALGITLLAIGLTLNTASGLGATPVITMPLTISEAWGFDYAVVVFCMYCCFALMQFLLNGGKQPIKALIQISFSFIISVLLSIFSKIIHIEPNSWGESLFILFCAIIACATGIFMMLHMDLISNPADVFANTIARMLGKEPGIGKNILDCSCVVISACIALAAGISLHNIGIGTLISAICVGRVIALLHRYARVPLLRFCGMRY